jgi:hypothetical protein
MVHVVWLMNNFMHSLPNVKIPILSYTTIELNTIKTTNNNKLQNTIKANTRNQIPQLRK